MHQLLTEFISERTECKTEEMNSILPYFQSKKVDRNEIIVQKGTICKHIYFVNKGCIRTYNITKEGDENTRYIAFEGNFGTALPNFIGKEISIEYVQAIEPSELLVIGHKDFYHLVETIPSFAAIYRNILELGFIQAQKRIYGIQGLDALDKFKWLLQNHPKIASRLSNKMTASYLGIKPETLSRVKQKM